MFWNDAEITGKGYKTKSKDQDYEQLTVGKHWNLRTENRYKATVKRFNYDVKNNELKETKLTAKHRTN